MKMTSEVASITGFESLLQESTRIHGHLCPVQVLGVKMSMLGLREIGILDPKGKDRKSIIVFVEMDRCATDAVQSVTGCSLGHRTMKFLDYGKMAATFLNLKTGRAVRVIAKEESRQKAKEYFPETESKYEAQLEAYKIMSDDNPRVLAGERIGRRELAELGHGGLCMKCEMCNYPVCPFGK